jgi:gliding motility associated protien GldN
MTKDDIDVNLDAVEKKTTVVDVNGNPQDTTYRQDRQIEQVKKVLIKEKWYFDKQHSTMQVRILGLCPIRVYPRVIQGQTDVEAEDDAEILMKPVFWVYYPEARNLLSSHPVYTRFNDAQPLSYDDLFMQRRFSGYIFKETNVYNNRLIQEYATGVEALLEAERIKEYLNVAADLEFETMNGEIWTDFDVAPLPRRPVREEARNDGRLTIRSGRSGVRIGAGGPLHSFETLNGDIYVRRGR